MKQLSHPLLHVGIITEGFRTPCEEDKLPEPYVFVRTLSEFCRVRVFPFVNPQEKAFSRWEKCFVFPETSVRVPPLTPLSTTHSLLTCFEQEYRKRRFDIIHAMGAHQAVKVGRTLSKKLKLPLVVTIPGEESETIPDTLRKYEESIRHSGLVPTLTGIDENLPYIPSKAEMEAVPAISKKPWGHKQAPKRVLAMRLSAMGDMVITLPYLAGLKQSYPDTRLDFLTLESWAGLARDLDLFGEVFGLKGEMKDLKVQSRLLLPKLLLKHYDVVIDLQGYVICRRIRRTLAPQGWSEFDKFSPLAAGHRVYRTIQALGLPLETPFVKPTLKTEKKGQELLVAHGYNLNHLLVVLNPAGRFFSRKWPLPYFVEFARLWRKRYPQTQFLFLGDTRFREEAESLKAQLGSSLIALDGQTTPSEAMAIIQSVDLVISEDSGLMHMAWVSEIPTVALFGSTRCDWSLPLGPYSVCLNSSDLLCGDCMEDPCQMGNVHCLQRYTPEVVFRIAEALWQKKST